MASQFLNRTSANLISIGFNLWGLKSFMQSISIVVVEFVKGEIEALIEEYGMLVSQPQPVVSCHF